MEALIISKCDKVLKELYKFSDSIITLGNPILDNRLEEFEKQIGLTLPFDFKFILTKHNYIALNGDEVFGIGKEYGNMSIENVYIFEHEEVGNPMFKELVPFSSDGYGNHYCLDLSELKNKECPVVFWQHDCSYSDRKDIEICNKNFVEWIKEVMIEWTLEDTNYDGSEK